MPLTWASLTLPLVAALCVHGQQAPAASSRLASIPGAQSAAGVLASSANGLAQYLAPNGPIQPALTAIGGLPMRGVEYANRGISRISSGFDSGARSLARQAGQDENNIRMPGMQTLGSAMPQSVASLGSGLMGGIRMKNSAIAGQAESGVQAGERLRDMMQSGVVRSGSQLDPLAASATMGHKVMSGAGSMMSGASDALSSGAEQLKNQLKSSLDGTMGRMSQIQGIGENVHSQAQGIARTLSTGLQNSASQLQHTGQQVAQQLQGGLKQNTQAMSGIMGSLQGSMGKMGENAQSNIQGIMRHAQNAAQLVSSRIQQAVQAPLNMIHSLSSSLGSLMSKGGGGGASSAGRY